MALALGRTVAELNATLTSEEFVNWMAYDQICPFGSERDNLHTGIVAASIQNQWAKKPVNPSDFMLKLPKPDNKPKMQGFLTFLQAVAVKK